MATIIVEDGSVVSGANSYVSEAELSAYATDRNITLSGDYGDASELLVRSMDYMEMLEYSGDKYSRDQPLQWPRVGVVVDDYSVSRETLPPDLKKAQLALAIAIDQGYDPLANVDRTQQRIKIDVIDITYDDSAASIPYAQTFSHRVRKLIRGGFGGNNFRLSR